jgi:hypothetical protein
VPAGVFVRKRHRRRAAKCHDGAVALVVKKDGEL